MLFYSVLFHLILPYSVLFCSVKHIGHDLLHWFHHRSVGLEPQFDEHWPAVTGQICWDGLSVPMCVSGDSFPPGPSWPVPTENFHSVVCQQPQTLSLWEEGMPSTAIPTPVFLRCCPGIAEHVRVPGLTRAPPSRDTSQPPGLVTGRAPRAWSRWFLKGGRWRQPEPCPRLSGRGLLAWIQPTDTHLTFSVAPTLWFPCGSADK